MYFYDERASGFAKVQQPSPRGELEITDLNRTYLDQGELHVEILGRGTAWLDTGSHDTLATATDFVKVIERRQGLKIACLEEIAYQRGFIDAEQVLRLAQSMAKNAYGEYLIQLVEERAG